MRSRALDEGRARHGPAIAAPRRGGTPPGAGGEKVPNYSRSERYAALIELDAVMAGIELDVDGFRLVERLRCSEDCAEINAFARIVREARRIDGHE